MIIYLYVKQHAITGLKYFGKTIRENPYTYTGSGKYWLRHVKKYGIEHINTIELYEFDEQEKCTEFALNFSKQNNIVESDEWANMIEENGLSGTPNGTILSEDHRRKIRESATGKKRSEETKFKMRIAWETRAPVSEESKLKNSESQKNKIVSKETRNKMRNSRTGCKHSEYTRKKISESQKGKKRKPHTEETKLKMRESQKRRFSESC